MGTLYATQVRGKEVFSFEYSDTWLQSRGDQNLDPDLQLYAGPQYLREGKNNFGIFLDSSPDRWGRVLMDRREALFARQEDRKPRTLFETDYLLGVYDPHRMGALRFKEEEGGEYLDNNKAYSTPPWTSIGELEEAAFRLEEDDMAETEKAKWLNMLLAPGSSLGGARPKASVMDNKSRLWIAKFPSKNDRVNVGAWEMVAHQLAEQAGVQIPQTSAGVYFSKHHTFLSRRFDRDEHGNRIHFASAMTLLGRTDGTDSQTGGSYLDIAGFIMQSGAQPDSDLEELWRRIVFYICISNTDDHLRNHGFLLTPDGWRLSPAYDLNPTAGATGLTLNISETDNSLDLDLAREVARYFRLSEKKAEAIIKKVEGAVGNWKRVAEKLGTSKMERERMTHAFAY